MIAQPVDVLVEPGAQPRPRHGERLVRDLDGVAVAGEQPGSDEPLHELRAAESPSTARVARASHRFARSSGATRRSMRLAQHALVARRPGHGRHPRRTGRRPRARRRSPGSPPRSGSSLAPLPRLPEHVGEQRERPGLPRRPRAGGGRRDRARGAARPGRPAPRWRDAGRRRPSDRGGAGPSRRGGRRGCADSSPSRSARSPSTRSPSGPRRRPPHGRGTVRSGGEGAKHLLALVHDEDVALAASRTPPSCRGCEPGVMT